MKEYNNQIQITKTLKMLITAVLMSVTAALLTPTAATATEVRAKVVTESERAAIAAAEKKKKAKKLALKKKKIQLKKKAKKKQTRLKLKKVVKVARSQKGKPYVYGGTGARGFDCSGLTQFVYKKATGKKLPRTSRDQRAVAKRVSAKNARVGDLVFFHKSSGVYHVGIYAGKNHIIHAPYSGTVVRKERIWSQSVTYGRVI